MVNRKTEILIGILKELFPIIFSHISKFSRPSVPIYHKLSCFVFRKVLITVVVTRSSRSWCGKTGMKDNLFHVYYFCNILTTVCYPQHIDAEPRSQSLPLYVEVLYVSESYLIRPSNLTGLSLTPMPL